MHWILIVGLWGADERGDAGAFRSYDACYAAAYAVEAGDPGTWAACELDTGPAGETT